MRFAAWLLLLSGFAVADNPEPSQVTLVEVENGGNGCPRGAITSRISSDRTVSYSYLLMQRHAPNVIVVDTWYYL
jgi:hypothetical protein